MFKHHRLTVDVHETGGVRSSGPQPAAKARAVDKAEAKVEAAFDALAKAKPEAQGEATVSADEFVAQRAALEGVTDKAGLAKEFKAYAGDDDAMNDAEFASYIRDKAKAGGPVALSADSKLAAAESQALVQGVKAASEGTAAQQREFNDWFAKQDGPTQAALAKDGVGPLTVDSKEGPLTREALRARGRVEAAKAAPPQPPAAPPPAPPAAPAQPPAPTPEQRQLKQNEEVRGAIAKVLGGEGSDNERAAAAAKVALYRPDAFTPEMVQKLGDDGVSEFMGKFATDRLHLDKLPPGTRQAMIQALESGWTTSEEYAMVDRLKASLAMAP